MSWSAGARALLRGQDGDWPGKEVGVGWEVLPQASDEHLENMEEGESPQDR